MKLDQDDGTYLVLDARVVKVEASDLMLDSAERHKGGGPFRRTLVHDQKDGLTINFAGDYPGGVTVAGPVHIAGPIDLEPTLPRRETVSWSTEASRMRCQRQWALIPVRVLRFLGCL
jgi:hypothetical protein